MLMVGPPRAGKLVGLQDQLLSFSAVVILVAVLILCPPLPKTDYQDVEGFFFRPEAMFYPGKDHKFLSCFGLIDLAV